MPLAGTALLTLEQSWCAPETCSLLMEISASWDRMQLVLFQTAPEIAQLIETKSHRGAFLSLVLHTDRIKARVWLAPSLQTVVIHSSSARMTHSASHSASWLCTEQRCCIWKAQAVAVQHLADAACQALLMTSTAKLTRTDPSVLWSTTRYRKRSTEILSEITYSALHGPLSLQFSVVAFFFCFFPSGFKSQCPFES